MLHSPLSYLSADAVPLKKKPTAVSEQPTTTPPAAPTRYDAKAFFTTTTYGLAGGYAWSLEDKALLVSSDETGIFNAWSMSPVDGERKPLTTSTTDSTFAVSWFPEDARALFTANQGGNELDHLYVREVSGETRDLTPGAEVKAQFVDWSGDRKSFYVLTNELDPAAFDLYRYAVKDYERTLVFRNDEAFDVQAVSPDGTTIALLRPRTSADSDIYLLDTRTGDAEPELITQHEGNVSHGIHEFTPDSKQLVYSTDEHGEFEQAWIHDLGTGEKAPLVSAAWDVMFVTYSDSGRYRVSAINEDASTVVRILDSERGEEVSLADLPPGDLAQIRFSRDESKIALMLSSDTSPNDVYTVDLVTGKGRRLTQALNPEIDEADLVESEVVRYESYDGLEIPSILYRPKQAAAEQGAGARVGTRRTGRAEPHRVFGDDPAPRQSRLCHSRRQQPRLVRLRQDVLPHG